MSRPANNVSGGATHYKLFFLPNMAEACLLRYKPPDAPSPPPPVKCPVCGAEHGRDDAQCPACAFQKDGDAAFYKKFIALPPEKRAEYTGRKNQIISPETGPPDDILGASRLVTDLKKEFGLWQEN
jgi:hypothetical protein